MEDLSAEKTAQKYLASDTEGLLFAYDNEEVILIGQEPQNPKHWAIQREAISELNPEYVLFPGSHDRGIGSEEFYDDFLSSVGPYTSVERIQEKYSDLGMDEFAERLDRLPQDVDTSLPDNWRDLPLGDSNELALEVTEAVYNQAMAISRGDVGKEKAKELLQHSKTLEGLYVVGPFNVSISLESEGLPQRKIADKLGVELPLMQLDEEDRMRLLDATPWIGAIYDLNKDGYSSSLGTIGISRDQMTSNIDDEELPPDRTPHNPDLDSVDLEGMLRDMAGDLNTDWMKLGDHRNMAEWNNKVSNQISAFLEERETDRPVMAVVNAPQVDSVSMQEIADRDEFVDHRSVGVSTVDDNLKDGDVETHVENLERKYPDFRTEELPGPGSRPM